MNPKISRRSVIKGGATGLMTLAAAAQSAAQEAPASRLNASRPWLKIRGI